MKTFKAYMYHIWVQFYDEERPDIDHDFLAYNDESAQRYARKMVETLVDVWDWSVNQVRFLPVVIDGELNCYTDQVEVHYTFKPIVGDS